MSQQQSSQWFQKSRRFFVYLITPLMVSSIGWLSNEVGDAFKVISNPLSIAFFALLTLLAFLLFCIVVVHNVNERDPYNPQNIQIRNSLIGRIALFFVVTLAMAVCIALVGNYLEDIIKSLLGNNVLWWALITATALCWLVDVFIVSNTKWHFSVNKRHLIFALGLTVMMIVIWLLNQEFPAWTIRLQKISLVIPTGYLVFLFFRITRTFTKPYNKLHQEDNLAQMQHLVLFLSNMSLKKELDTAGEHVLYTYFNAPKDENGRRKISLEILKNMTFQVRENVYEAKELARYFKYRCASIDRSKRTESDSLVTICDEIAQCKKLVKWEMPLRAIAHHIDKFDGKKYITDKLTDITLFISKNSDPQQSTKLASNKEKSNVDAEFGSAETVKYFIECLKHYFKEDLPTIRIAYCDSATNNASNDKEYKLVKITTDSQYEDLKQKGIDFSSYQDITDALDSILQEQDIIDIGHANSIIDVTGGPKPTSVAGALAATVLDIMNQYVDTNDKKVKGYDFQYVDPTKSA